VVSPSYDEGDAAGRLSGVEVRRVDDLSVEYLASYGYDAQGILDHVSGPGLPPSGVKYHRVSDPATGVPLGDLIDRVDYLGSAGSPAIASVARSYEEHRNLVTGVTNTRGETTVSAYSYANDDLGRRAWAARAGSAFAQPNFDLYGMTDWPGYDDRNELIWSLRYNGTDPDSPDEDDGVWGLSYSYTYDLIGNRKASTTGDRETVYGRNALNQYTVTYNPDEAFVYDSDGNMTADGTFTYTWDAENRLTSVTPKSPLADGAKKLVLAYDYMGRRVRKQVYTYADGAWSEMPAEDRLFVYYGWNLLMELDGLNDNVPLRKYTWGLDLSGTLTGAGGIGGLLGVHDSTEGEGGADYLYFADANGNVGQVVQPFTGEVVAQYEYDPYGNIVGPDTDDDGDFDAEDEPGAYTALNPFRFSTKYWDDESGLGYWGYRYYTPRLGRWMSRDPIGEDGGANLYSFLKNGVPNRYDAKGLEDSTIYFKCEPCKSFNCKNDCWKYCADHQAALKSRSAGGLSFCVCGCKCACVDFDKYDRFSTNTVAHAKFACTLAHEEYHIKDRLTFCSALTFIVSYWPGDAQRAECGAAAAQINCLCAEKRKCATETCKREIDMEIYSTQLLCSQEGASVGAVFSVYGAADCRDTVYDGSTSQGSTN